MVFTDIKVKINAEEGNYGEYAISPLPKGYGFTLANSIRRVLLSSLPGSGITSIKVNGVKHEYSTIENVKEDVVEIILNLKNVKFKKASSDEAAVCTVDVSGKKAVTAGDIKTPAGVEVVNKDVVIATLTDAKAKLSMELVVENGLGYQYANEELRSEVGRLPLDTDFSPVISVAYEVRDARKGQKTNLDSATIKIETDGSIEPKQALIDSAKILQDFAGKTMIALGISEVEVIALEEEANTMPIEEVVEENTVEDEVSGWKVEDLPISKRSKSGLLAGGFESVGDVAKVTSTELLELPGFGNKSLNEVVELMKEYGIDIKAE